MTTKLVFKISGMHCNSCGMNIDGEFEDSGKIKKVRTNYAKEQTEVEFDPKEISELEIIALIKQVGYDAKLQMYDNLSL